MLKGSELESVHRIIKTVCRKGKVVSKNYNLAFEACEYFNKYNEKN